MLYLPKSFLPQMTPEYVQRESWCLGGWHLSGEDHIYQRCICNLCAPYLLWLRRCGLLWHSSSRFYLRWRVGVSCKTSSPMWYSWNLPMFPLRDRSLTLMYMASLMVLEILCASLPREKVINCTLTTTTLPFLLLSISYRMTLMWREQAE